MKIEIFGNTPPVIWMHVAPGEGETLGSLFYQRATLICVSAIDWNDALSPWPAEAVFKNNAPFGGHAAMHLQTLTQEVLPETEGRLPFSVAQRFLAGYSMAGLFAAYAMYHCDCFSRIATVSGSLWYDGWADYARAHAPSPSVQKIYVSLGMREHRTRNARMARVQTCTETLVDYWRQFCSVTYERMPGGHFHEPSLRMAKAIEQLLKI